LLRECHLHIKAFVVGEVVDEPSHVLTIRIALKYIRITLIFVPSTRPLRSPIAQPADQEVNLLRLSILAGYYPNPAEGGPTVFLSHLFNPVDEFDVCMARSERV
jgi:hypothetical protein